MSALCIVHARRQHESPYYCYAPLPTRTRRCLQRTALTFSALDFTSLLADPSTLSFRPPPSADEEEEVMPTAGGRRRGGAGMLRSGTGSQQVASKGVSACGQERS